MRRIKIFLVLVLIVAMVIAAGEYKRIGGTKYYTVTCDDGGDSTFVDSAFSIGKSGGYRTITGRIIAYPAIDGFAGLGNQDSCWLWIYAAHDATPSTDSTKLYLIDSTVVEDGFPCTLYVNLHSNVGDTLLKNNLIIRFQVYDSLGDTAHVARYPIKYELTLK